jgi:hypothetical protein
MLLSKKDMRVAFSIEAQHVAVQSRVAIDSAVTTGYKIMFHHVRTPAQHGHFFLFQKLND